MPRVLDIDLDVFVRPIENLHRDSRVPDDSCETWSERAVQRFLEEVCHLRRELPKPGMVFEEHDELFDGIARAVGTGVLEAPFDLVHVDAHADIGCGQFRYIKHLLTDLMHRPVNQRSNPVRGERGLNRGTVVLFLAAQGWLCSLTYVHHPDDGKDLPIVFLDYDLDREQHYFQLPRCDARRLDDWMKLHVSAEQLGEICEYPLETRIPLDVIPIADTVPSDYDFVTVTRSPGFTPPKADAIFGFIAQYIAPVA